MKIGIDARPLVRRRTGIGRFLGGLLAALSRDDRGYDYILYSPRHIDFSIPNPRWRTRMVPGIRGLKGSLWLQLVGKQLAERDEVDVFWGPAFHLPVLLDRRIPAMVTVHDLVHVFSPQTMEWQNYMLMKLLLRPSLWRAQHITADSESTAQDLQRRMHVEAGKISVVYPGVTSDFSPRDREEARRYVAAAFGQDGPYLLTVSTLEPRKNLNTLLRAFALVPAGIRSHLRLLIAGAKGWKNSSIYATAAPLLAEGSVRFLGYVSDDDLPWLYAGAALFLFPSVYEGFGIPIAEAMASGVPAIVSDIPVSREVAADAARFVDPLDASGWARAVEELLDDSRQQETLRQRGVQVAAAFTCHRSAERLLTVVERVVVGHRGITTEHNESHRP